MATDGVKIIDGDLAHDTYWGIMDLYDSGTDLELIKKEYPLERSYYDEFNQEIYITAYALAFWEIGALTDEIIEQVRSAIDKAAGVRGWTEECGIEAGKARQKELNKLWSKINTPKIKVRKQKKYRTITRFHYNQGEVLTFKGSDNFYYCTYLLFISQYRGECVYHFIPFVYRSEQKPQLSDVLSSSLVGRIIPSSLDLEGYVYGLCANGILHQEMPAYKSHFEKIGQFYLMDKYRKLGQQGGSRDWINFSKWHEQIEENIRGFGMKQFRIADMILSHEITKE
jgi:hypothetical protein